MGARSDCRRCSRQYRSQAQTAAERNRGCRRRTERSVSAFRQGPIPPAPAAGRRIRQKIGLTVERRRGISRRRAEEETFPTPRRSPRHQGDPAAPISTAALPFLRSLPLNLPLPPVAVASVVVLTTSPPGGETVIALEGEARRIAPTRRPPSCPPSRSPRRPS